MPKTAKPKKPYPDFPLFAHQTGQWAKKIRGKTFYFGTDSEAALKKYTAKRGVHRGGQGPGRSRGGQIVVYGQARRPSSGPYTSGYTRERRDGSRPL